MPESDRIAVRLTDSRPTVILSMLFSGRKLTVRAATEQNCTCLLGFVEFLSLVQILSRFGLTPAQMKHLLTKIPLNRIGHPDEIARMVVALASDIAFYVTGTTIFVDGGMTDYPSFAQGG